MSGFPWLFWRGCGYHGTWREEGVVFPVGEKNMRVLIKAMVKLK